MADSFDWEQSRRDHTETRYEISRPTPPGGAGNSYIGIIMFDVVLILLLVSPVALLCLASWLFRGILGGGWDVPFNW